MPQPFPYTPKPDEKLIHGTAALEARPKLATAIAAVCAHSNELEQALAFLFVQMLSAREGAAVAIYSTLVDRRLKAEAMKAVAAAILAKAEQKELDGILVAMNSVSKRRNIVVHGLWAALDRKPDSLLLKDAAQTTKEFFTIIAKLQEREDLLRQIDSGEITHDQWVRRRDAAGEITNRHVVFNLVEYKAHDFQDIMRAMEELRARISKFSTSLSRARSYVPQPG